MHLTPGNTYVFSGGNEPQVIHVVCRRSSVNGQEVVPERLLQPDLHSTAQPSHHILNVDLQTPSSDFAGSNALVLRNNSVFNISGHLADDGRRAMHGVAGSEENHTLVETARRFPMIAGTNTTYSSQSSSDNQVVSLTQITTSYQSSQIPYDSSSSPPIHGSSSRSQEIAQPLGEPSGQAVNDDSVLQTLLHPNAAYPEYILDTLAYTSDLPPFQQNFCSLWTYVLEYWFPSTEGFEVVQDWNPNDSFRVQGIVTHSGIPLKAKPSLAVFDSVYPTQPFLFVDIRNGIPVNDLSRMYSKTTLEESFETLRACSFSAGFQTLCVVSAVGARWSMVLRDAGWLEDGTGTGTDYVGALEEDVTSSESYRVMGYCFEEIKRSVSRRRQEFPTGSRNRGSPPI